MEYPEKHLHKKPALRPRGQQGMTQTRGTRIQPKIHEPPSKRRIHGFALQKALLGIANKAKSRDGSR